MTRAERELQLEAQRERRVREIISAMSQVEKASYALAIRSHRQRIDQRERKP